MGRYTFVERLLVQDSLGLLDCGQDIRLANSRLANNVISTHGSLPGDRQITHVGTTPRLIFLGDLSALNFSVTPERSALALYGLVTWRTENRVGRATEISHHTPKMNRPGWLTRRNVSPGANSRRATTGARAAATARLRIVLEALEEAIILSLQEMRWILTQRYGFLPITKYPVRQLARNESVRNRLER